MCGIVAYVGRREAAPLLIDGLRRLEYRGYDSCGVALLNGGHPEVIRATGRIDELDEKLRSAPAEVKAPFCGIGHTRWATHGRPSEENAHPHRDCTGQIAVVHNGIIENYLELRRHLEASGHVLRTSTDTEVLPHLIEAHFKGDLEQAVIDALGHVEGVFGIAVVSSHDPMTVIAARKGPPLVIGLGDGENFLASDIPALLTYTQRMLFINDCEIATIRSGSVQIRNFSGKPVDRQPELVTWSMEMAERQGFPHFMLKEIYEQPAAVRSTLEGLLDVTHNAYHAEVLPPPDILRNAQQVLILGCGTSLHAGLIGKYMIERVTGMHVEVDYASEFRYRQPVVRPGTIAIAISQSGETADTLGALRHARQKGAFAIAICNVAGSMAARQSDCVLHTKAGPEIGVASTKTFTSQLVVLYTLAVYMGQLRNVIARKEFERRINLLKDVPDQMLSILSQTSGMAALAELISNHSQALYLGRGINYPIALEGALKLKEISYIHAEGYPAGEMKHGPIALVDSRMPVVVVAPRDPLYRKTLSNLEEIRVRGGIILSVASDHDREIEMVSDHVMRIPGTDPLLNPMLAALPLQVLAYHAAVMRGCDVDKPRNLAKSVTVE